MYHIFHCERRTQERRSGGRLGWWFGSSLVLFMACINMFNPDHPSLHDAAMSPRMSFSSDFNMQPPPARTPGPPPDSDFEFSVGSHPMMAADQLFFKGRLLPLKDNHQCGGHRITTLRDELRADGSGERLPKGSIKWRGLLGLRKTAAKKGDKKEDELPGKSPQDL